ncbi:helix-turn-helix transcriptional regulator [Wenjunlia tyrosinilytica]|jgi:transcriptional regulator with XRE-family HTH domain|uniref:HTH cro/C1-type domain-containing protein n=1 Tax=Wenjunlia tyrosinilytica TaxID=1544741 RepID=A0A917ZS43_9ACTN|nr:helix-turn-helix transcriptional regulator [Wenjunlia tyrosinilytica]GGO90621.1 hypothetical protein GCM10012280_36560 [Wenjunlia tyrosinilytica]
MSIGSSAEERAQRVARRLRTLFTDIHPHGRGPWTHQEAAEACGVPVEEIERLSVGLPLDGDGFATRLDRLFLRTSPATGKPYSNREAGAAVGRSAPYIGGLRSGAGEPEESVVPELARFFGVSAAYLLGGPIGPLAQHFRVRPAFLTEDDDAPDVRAWQRMARRLRLLFADIYPAGRGPWTHLEVAEACGVPVEDVRRLCAGAPLELEGGAFAARLDQLCLRTSPATGKPYSNREVGAAVGKSGQYMGNLRAGVNEPGLPVASELAAFFGVSVSYFVHGPIKLVAQHFRVAEVYLTADDDSPAVREIEDSLRTLIALRDERVQRVVGRVLNKRWPR